MKDHIFKYSYAETPIQPCSTDSDRMFISEREPFLIYSTPSFFKFDEVSAIYCSLSALVKAEYPFDNALQDRAARFLGILGPQLGHFELANKLITDLVPTSDGSNSGIIDSIFTLLSSPHSTIVSAALSFLHATTRASSAEIRCQLTSLDIITNVLTTVQPHSRPISGHETIFMDLIGILNDCIFLAYPSSLNELGITSAVDKQYHREMIFQKVVIPSSPFVAFLISNRHFLYRHKFPSFTQLFDPFMSLLSTLLLFGPYHRPTFDNVFASPIAMILTSCYSLVENWNPLWTTLFQIADSLKKRKTEGPEVARSGKQIFRALFSEGFENMLEQTLWRSKDDLTNTITNVVYLIEMGYVTPTSSWLAPPCKEHSERLIEGEASTQLTTGQLNREAFHLFTLQSSVSTSNAGQEQIHRPTRFRR